MLQRSLWSGLCLSAAVTAAGLLGVSTARAQETAPTSAAAPAPVVQGTNKADDESIKLADDLLHYSRVNNVEMAKASADKLLEKALAPDQMLHSFEASSNPGDFRNTLLQDLRRDELKDSVSKVLNIIDEGYRNVSRDLTRVRSDIDRLASGPRPYQNAKDRLTAAGQFAVPIYLEYLQNNAKKDLHPYIIRLMGEIGRPILLPLIEELRVSDPTLRIELINVIGQIGYPQALPALRQIDADPATSGELKSAVERAISLIDRSGRAATMSAADLYVAGGENYYNKKASYAAPLAEKTNPIWYFDANLNNVVPVQIPTEIWNDVMAMRAAESAIKLDSDNAAAISLWMAANLKRELSLPAGATVPSRPASAMSGDFYAEAAGPAYLNPVLARALDNQDAPLALKAIQALTATGGVSGLVSDKDSPLVRALSNSDRSVRFTAAFALAKANPNTQFPSFFRVVPILCEAISNSSAPTALLVVKDDDMRNAVTAALRGSDAHYVVYAGSTLSAALEQARRAPAIDLVIVPAEDDNVQQVENIGRSDYRFTGVPVLVASPAADITKQQLRYAQDRFVGVIDDHADAAMIGTALNKIRGDLGVVPISAETANNYGATALQLLDMLAADHRSIFAVNEATPTLVAALKDGRPEIVTASAGVIGKLNSPEGERALAAAALGDGDPAVRAMFFRNLAESAKRTGNSLDGSQVNAIIKIVNTDGDAKLRNAAAEALGALNVPSNQASALILQQAR